MTFKEILLEDGLCTQVSNARHFDLRQIAESGQCFRMDEIWTDRNVLDSYSVCSGDRHVLVDTLPPENPMEAPACFIFHCPLDEFKNYWHRYFCLDKDWHDAVDGIIDGMGGAEDVFLKDALRVGYGIRILRQELWETMVSFMISQNNKIPRIRKSIYMLCRRFGKLQENRGIFYDTFPSIEDMQDGDFDGLGLGYRKAYFDELLTTSNKERLTQWLSEIETANYAEARKLLMEARGIGPKVADCICLYGLHHMEAYPIDTWMRKLIDQVYGGKYDLGPLDVCGGYIQQLQFYHYRSHWHGICGLEGK